MMEKITRQMQRIEDTDPNFAKNKKWLKLRAMQDQFYLEKAQMQLDSLNVLEKRGVLNDKQKQKKEFLKNYIDGKML